MYCILKSQINGKPFLIVPADTSSDVIKMCNEKPMNSVWQIIELGSGKVFPVTSFSGSPGTIAFSCKYSTPESVKQKTSK
jgi:hypothetical protein|nr:MAG TPA: hypothetical protein [Caudoviricetes sp.]